MVNDKKDSQQKSEPIISLNVGEYTFKDLGKAAERQIESSVKEPIKDK